MPYAQAHAGSMCLLRRIADMLGKVPLMSFKVFSAIDAVSILFVHWFGNDLSTCSLRTIVVIVYAGDGNVLCLSHMPKALRAFVLRARIAHHYNGPIKFHFGMG